MRKEKETIKPVKHFPFHNEIKIIIYHHICLKICVYLFIKFTYSIVKIVLKNYFLVKLIKTYTE